MPNACNLTKFFCVIDSIDDPVRPENKLPNVVIPVLRDDTTRLGKIHQAIRLRDQFISEGHCTVSIITRDEGDYIVQVVASSGRPNQFVSHEANCLLTSS